jgi:glycosyltransferase involved in cell wall biosynthesis
MRIDLYTRCWNDAHMLGFFFRHYDRFVSRYIVYDDGSTDSSLDILHAHPRVEVRRLSYEDPASRILSAVSLFDHCWKESRGSADWVIVTDVDEHLSHPDLGPYLAACKAAGVTIIPATGYQMLSEDFPDPDSFLERDVVMGSRWPMMDKLNIFSPEDVREIRYTPGRHLANPTGRILLPPADEMLLLHYKYLDFEKLYERHTMAARRSRPLDIERRYGHEYFWSRDQLHEEWKLVKDRLVDVGKIGRSSDGHPPGEEAQIVSQLEWLWSSRIELLWSSRLDPFSARE